MTKPANGNRRVSEKHKSVNGTDSEGLILEHPQPGPSKIVGEPLDHNSSGNGQPQVIVRIRSSTNIGNNVLEVTPAKNVVKIKVDREEKEKDGKAKIVSEFLHFPADIVLEHSSQDDVFTAVAMDVVEQALGGTPGIVVAVGSERSGKTFSLFGLNRQYSDRGIIPRALEKMLELKASKSSEHELRFGIGIIEVRRDKIRDLLTLDPQEINDVGNRGPKGMYVEEIDSLEQGLALLLRARVGQKLIHQEPSERYHTIVYLEIQAVSPDTPDDPLFRSRITFAEIASVPSDTVQTSPTPIPVSCKKSFTTGPLADSIGVRRDIFTLEQIFNQVNEMHQARMQIVRLESLGLFLVASEKRRLSLNQNFRQSRLAHCLKDILDCRTIIKIFLHVRPGQACLKSSLEVMRFGERARRLPCCKSCNVDGKENGNEKVPELEEPQATSGPDIPPEVHDVKSAESAGHEETGTKSGKRGKRDRSKKKHRHKSLIRDPSPEVTESTTRGSHASSDGRHQRKNSSKSQRDPNRGSAGSNRRQSDVPALTIAEEREDHLRNLSESNILGEAVVEPSQPSDTWDDDDNPAPKITTENDEENYRKTSQPRSVDNEEISQTLRNSADSSKQERSNSTKKESVAPPAPPPTREQIISANFDDMKKLARKQAIDLIRSGRKRPQWNSF